MLSVEELKKKLAERKALKAKLKKMIEEKKAAKKKSKP